MADLRLLVSTAMAAFVTACSAQSPQERTDAAELAAVAPLRQQYSGLVAGFDIRPQNTLIVSLDLQQYIETDDDVIAAMKRATLARWRAAWIAAHPHEHGLLTVRFIDFIGRRVAQETTKV
jgi:hypothetical protein